jgi:hypothetical protein
MAPVWLLCSTLVAAVAATAPITKRDNPSAVPNEFIVELKKGATDITYKGKINIIRHFRVSDWHALHVEVPEEDLLKLAEDPNVKLIEAETRDVYCAAVEQSECTSQNITDSGLWGLGRLSSRPLDTSTYRYDTDGTGVNVYVLDTGNERRMLSLETGSKRASTLFRITRWRTSMDTAPTWLASSEAV